jgi:threonine 3-dehydrogenase
MSVMVQSGLDVSPVITHHFSHADHEEAFATAASGKAGKVILHWSE